MKIIEFKALEGRNIYFHKKVIRMDIDLEGVSKITSKKLSQFNEKLLKVMPQLLKDTCNEDTYFTNICKHMVITLQNIMGIEVCYGKSTQINAEHYFVIYQYEYKNTEIGRASCRERVS